VWTTPLHFRPHFHCATKPGLHLGLRPSKTLGPVLACVMYFAIPSQLLPMLRPKLRLLAICRAATLPICGLATEMSSLVRLPVCDPTRTGEMPPSGEAGSPPSTPIRSFLLPQCHFPLSPLTLRGCSNLTAQCSNHGKQTSCWAPLLHACRAEAQQREWPVRLAGQNMAGFGRGKMGNGWLGSPRTSSGASAATAAPSGRLRLRRSRRVRCPALRVTWVCSLRTRLPRPCAKRKTRTGRSRTETRRPPLPPRRAEVLRGPRRPRLQRPGRAPRRCLRR